MTESPVKTPPKALGLHFISKMVLTCLWQLESHVEFIASNVDDAWKFFSIVRNPNITVSNRKTDLNSHLNSRSVRIVLPHLVYIPKLSLIPWQVSWLNWTNSSFEWTSPPYLENIPQVPAATRENPWDFPLAARWAPIPLHWVQSNCVFPTKHVRSLNLHDWTTDSPQKHCHKTRRTLMSPQECKIALCTQNQIGMRPISLALAQ